MTDHENKNQKDQQGETTASLKTPPGAEAPSAVPTSDQPSPLPFHAVTPTTPIDRYQVLHEIGQGGMGVVYRARDCETGEFVALKMLKPEVAADPAVFDRFLNELRLARKITHKNVCRIHDFTRLAGAACISMEFVDGESLRQVLRRFGSLGPKKVLEIARQMCAGLREAHAQGVIHRDLKPENVMVDRAGQIKLMDFGIARTIETGEAQFSTVVGTPAYMAPEQFTGASVDRRADIYSLGLVLYECLMGVPAFSAKSTAMMAAKQVNDRPASLETAVPEWFQAILLKCLEKDATRRFQTVDELLAALAAGEASVERRKLRLRGGWVAAAALLLAAGFWLGWQFRPMEPPVITLQGPAPPATPPSSGPTSPDAASASGIPAGKPGGPSGQAAQPASTIQTSTLVIARDAKELAQLRRQATDLAFYDFDLRESNQFTQVGPVSLRLNKGDAKRQLFTITLQSRNRPVEMRDRSLFEPVRFYHDASRQMLELVVFLIEENRVLGYVTAPKSVRIPKGPAKPKS